VDLFISSCFLYCCVFVGYSGGKEGTGEGRAVEESEANPSMLILGIAVQQYPHHAFFLPTR
jgi:hypothetical protein